MCSRLALDRYGRQVVVVTTPSPGQPVGMRFLVIGNAARAAEDGLYFLQDAAAEARSMRARRRESLTAAPVDARKDAIRREDPAATVDAPIPRLNA